MSKVHRFAFLDPFAGELDYSGHRLLVEGEVDPGEVARGVAEVVHELVGELDLNPRLTQELKPWARRFKNEINQLGLDI